MHHVFQFLKARDDYIQSLKEETLKQLIILTEDQTKYKTILLNLLLQGLYLLLENEVLLKCRKRDLDIVKQLLPQAITKYKQEFNNKDLKVNIDEKNFLPDESAGGIELYAMGGKIKVSNTIEARLNMIFTQILPEIRQKLFGANKNRIYHD